MTELAYTEGRENDYYLDHFVRNARDFIKVDMERFLTLLEIIYYVIIFLTISLFTGLALNKVFPRADNDKTRIQLVGEVILQVVALAILIYYILLMGKIIPFPAGYVGKYRPNRPALLTVIASSMSIVLMATQTRMFAKIALIGEKS